jgi:hypothetical protein
LVDGQIDAGALGKGAHQRSVEIALENRGMDLAFSAYGGGVAEVFGEVLDRSHDRRFEGRVAIGLDELCERHRRELSAGPGAEILSRDVLATCLA